MTDTVLHQSASGGTPSGPAAPAADRPAAPAKPKPDARYLALRNFAISMSVFNILGYTVLGFEQPWLWPFIALSVGYTTELVFELISAWAQRRSPRFLGKGGRGMYEFLLPAHITSLACNMLLYANNQILPIIFAVFVGVAGKHAFQAPVNGRMRHFMNPSNLGISAALVCFGSWVSIAPPYEFTEKADTLFRVMIPLIIATAGTVINGVLTKRVALIVGWVGGFFIQALVRHAIWHVALFSAFGPATGVAFVLYTNYMISDPGTTPSKPRNQFMFGSFVALSYAVLMVANVTYTLFFATVVACGIRGIMWWGIEFYRRYRSRQADGLAPAADGTSPVGAVAA
jgi:hypothetical protein